MRSSRPVALGAWLFLLTAVSAQVQIRPLLSVDGETSEPNLSPDGKTLAFDWCKPDYSCGIYTRPLAGVDIELLAGKDVKESMPVSPRWSPDGRRISFVRIYSHFDNHLILRDSMGGAEHDLGVICDREFQTSWSPDGRLLIASVYTEDPPRTFCLPAYAVFGRDRSACSSDSYAWRRFRLFPGWSKAGVC